ncbi:MAG: Bug family tripartite tricarboxylate transporter substrate binding protein [Betaproteobacteria bacterium]
MRPILVSFALLLALPAAAQEWPSRPVTLINPFAAASAVDVVTRLVAQRMTTNTGKSFLVENRTGASGNIGTEAAARAKPDGYTFLVGSPGSMAINPFLFKKLPYDAAKDFAAVTALAAFPQVLIVNPKLPVSTMAELIAHAKANPGKLNHASSGSGSTAHLVMELIKADAGLTITHVPFRGGSPATQAVIAGDVQMAVEGLPSLPAHLRAGTVRPIAVTSLKRAPSLPNVPAVSETIGDFDAAAWIILFAPTGTPAAIIERMAQEAGRAIQDAEVKAKLADMGASPVGGTPAQTAAFHKKEMAKFKRAVEISGAIPD